MLNRNINKNLLRLSQNLKQRGNFVESPDVDINKWFSDNEVVNDNSFIPIGWNVGKIFSVNGTTYSFSRDTGAYRYNASGIIEWMEVNVPRIDWTNSKWQGLLLESDNYNYINNDFYTYTSNNVSKPTITEIDGFDSYINGYRVEKANSDDILYVNQYDTLDDGWWVFSIYMKRGVNIEPTITLDDDSLYWFNDVVPTGNWSTNEFTAQKYGKEYYKEWTRYWIADKLTINKKIKPSFTSNANVTDWWMPQLEYSYKEPFGPTSPIRGNVNYSNVLYFNGATTFKFNGGLSGITIANTEVETHDNYYVECWIKVVSSSGDQGLWGSEAAYISNGRLKIGRNNGTNFTETDNTYSLVGQGWKFVKFDFNIATDTYTVYVDGDLYYQKVFNSYLFGDPSSMYIGGFGSFGVAYDVNSRYANGLYLKYFNFVVEGEVQFRTWFNEPSDNTTIYSYKENAVITTDGGMSAVRQTDTTTSTFVESGLRASDHLDDISIIPGRYTQGGTLKTFIEGEIENAWTWKSELNYNGVTQSRVFSGGTRGYMKWNDNQRGFLDTASGMTSRSETWNLLGDGTWVININGTQSTNSSAISENKVFYERQWYRGSYNGTFSFFDNNRYLINDDFFNQTITGGSTQSSTINYSNGFSTDLSQEFEIDVLNSGYDYELNVKNNNEIIKNVILDNSYLKITTIKPLYNFTEGANDYITLVYTSLNVTGEYFEFRIYPTSSGVVASSGSLYYIRIDGETHKITIFSSPSSQQQTTTDLVANLNEWNVIRLEKTDSGYDLTVNGTTEVVNSVEYYWIYNIGSSSLNNFGGYLDYVDAGDNGYWNSNTGFVDEVNNNDAIINLSNYRTNNVTALSNNNTQWDFIEFETKSNFNLNVNLYGDNTYTFGISFSYVANPTLFRLDNSYNLYRYNSTWEAINKLSSSGTNTTLSSIKIESTNEIDSLWVKNIKAYKQIVNLELTGNNNQEGIWTPLNLNTEAELTYTVAGLNSYPQWIVRLGEGPSGDNLEQLLTTDGVYRIGNTNYHSGKAWRLDPNNSTTGVDGSDYLLYSNSSQWEYFPGTANYTFGTFSIYISSDETSNYNLLTTVDNISVWSNDVVNSVKADIVITDISTSGYMTMKWSDTNIITFSSIGYYTLEESNPNNQLQFIMDPNGIGSSNVEISYLKIYQSSYNTPEVRQWGIWPLGIDEQYLDDITFTSPVIGVSISTTDIWAPINTLSFNNNRKMWIRGLLWEGSGYDFGNTIQTAWYSNNQLNRTTYLNDILGNSDIRGEYSWNDLGQLDGYISVNNWNLNNLSLVVWIWMNGSVHILPRSDEDGYADIGLIKKDNILSLGPFGVTVSWVEGWNQYAITLNGATISYYHNGNEIDTYKHNYNPMLKRWLQLNDSDVSTNWGGNSTFNDSIRSFVNQRCLYFDGTGNTYITSNWSNPIETSVHGFADIWIKPTNPTNGRFVDASTGGEMFRWLQVRSDNTIGSFIAKQDYAVISDGQTGGNTTYSSKTWDWDNGDWYKISVGKERNESNDGTNLYVKVNDEIAIQWYVSDVDKAIEGYTFAWDLDEIGQRSGGINFYEGYIHSITFPTGLSLNFEEGFGDTIYSNEGDVFTLSYSGVDSSHVRLEQFDAPLSNSSADYIGWGYQKSLDLTQEVIDYTDGDPQSLPWVPSTVPNGNEQLFTTPTFGSFRIQHRAATVVGDTSTSYQPEGKGVGFYQGVNGVYVTIYSNEANPVSASSNIEIESFVGGEIQNGRYEFYYKTNNPFVVSVTSYVFENAVEAAVIDADNLTDDPDQILSSNLDTEDRYTIQGVALYVANVNANATKVQTIEDLFQQYALQSVAEFEAASIAKGRLDICTRMTQRTIVSVDNTNRNIFSSISDSGFIHNLPSTDGNGARSFAMFGVPLPSIALITIQASTTYNTVEYGGDGNDILLEFYFGNIRNQTIIPKNNNNNTDINGENLVFSNRLDYSYFNHNYDVTAFKTDRTTNAYGQLKTPITFNNDSVIKIETLFTNYTRESYSTLVGSSLGDNYHMGFHRTSPRDFFSWRWDGGSIFTRSLGITLSENLPFILSIDMTKAITISNINMTVYDTDYNSLDSWDFAPNQGFNAAIDSLYSSNGGDRIPIATIPWTKIWIGGTLSHFWTSYDTTTAKLYDVVGLNHATISTNNLSNNWENQTSWNPLWELGFNDNIPGQFNKNIDVNGNKLRYPKHTYLPISNVETYINKFSDGTPYSTWFTVEDKNEITDTTYIGRRKEWINGFSGSVIENNNLGFVGWWNSTLTSDEVQQQWQNFELDDIIDIGQDIILYIDSGRNSWDGNRVYDLSKSVNLGYPKGVSYTSDFYEFRNNENEITIRDNYTLDYNSGVTITFMFKYVGGNGPSEYIYYKYDGSNGGQIGLYNSFGLRFSFKDPLYPTRSENGDWVWADNLWHMVQVSIESTMIYCYLDNDLYSSRSKNNDENYNVDNLLQIGYDSEKLNLGHSIIHSKTLSELERNTLWNDLKTQYDIGLQIRKSDLKYYINSKSSFSYPDGSTWYDLMNKYEIDTTSITHDGDYFVFNQDYVQTTDTLETILGATPSDFTFIIFIKPGIFAQDLASGYLSTEPGRWDLYIHSTGQIRFRHHITGTNELSVNSINLNEWNIVSITYNITTSEVKFYINGLLESPITISATGLNTNVTLKLGQAQGVYSDDYTGLINSVLMYNAELTQSELDTIYSEFQTKILNI